MIDGHMHLEYGDLSKEYVLQFVESAVKNGMDEIQILDHTHRFKEFRPVYEGVRKASPYQEEWLNNKEMKFHSTLDEYCALIKEIKAMDLPIKVSFGLEVCYVPEYEETIREILKPYHFDFLVGAIHSIDGKLYDMKWSEEILWNKYPVDEIYKRYYECVFSLVKSDLFTQLAHPDTIKMFGHYPTYDLQPTYDELAELKSSYSDLESQFDSVKSLYYNNGDTSQVQKYNDARLELTKADSAIQNVQSALDSGKSSNEVDSRIDFAKEKLQNATVAYNNL